MPLPPAGKLNVRDITHSAMVLYWDAAPGLVRKYIVKYKPEDGDSKEVSLAGVMSNFPFVASLKLKACVELMVEWLELHTTWAKIPVLFPHLQSIFTVVQISL